MRRLLAWLCLALLPASPVWALAIDINGITDLNLGTWGIGDPAVNGSIDLCIAAALTVPLSGYSVTATGSGGFTLSSGSNHIPYSLTWEGSGVGNLGTSPGTQLANGVQLGGQSGAYTLSAPFCSTGNNARLHIRIAQADMVAALAGTYSGTITLLISPP